MKWIIDFLFCSSIGRKVVMSLTGFFLMLFLLVHLLGNLQLLKQDNGMQFNLYTYFMTHNPVIKLISYILYATIILHTIQGIVLAWQNRKAKGRGYAVHTNVNGSYFAKYMIHLGILIFIFLIIHLYQFWLPMKTGASPIIQYPGHEHTYQDLYTPVVETFKNIGFVIFYILSMAIASMHLLHGFRSAFQSIGINFNKYNSLIQFLAWFYSIMIPIGFAILPLYIYLTRA